MHSTASLSAFKLLLPSGSGNLSLSTSPNSLVRPSSRQSRLRPIPGPARCLAALSSASSEAEAGRNGPVVTAAEAPLSRRAVLRGAALAAAAATVAEVGLGQEAAWAAPKAVLPKVDDSKFRLCTGECEEKLNDLPTVTTSSGLQYKDIVVGKGDSPPVGFQVTVDYVAMLPDGRVFNSSLERGEPYIVRVGTGQVLPGLDEGLLSMKTGGVRRLYIPGELAFPKGLPAAAGRPKVLPASPVMFDVALLYIPGISDDIYGDVDQSSLSEGDQEIA